MNDRQREFTKYQRFKNNNHNRAPNPSCLLRDGPRYLTSYHYSNFFSFPAHRYWTMSWLLWSGWRFLDVYFRITMVDWRMPFPLLELITTDLSSSLWQTHAKLPRGLDSLQNLVLDERSGFTSTNQLIHVRSVARSSCHSTRGMA